MWAKSRKMEKAREFQAVFETRYAHVELKQPNKRELVTDSPQKQPVQDGPG